MKRVFLIVLDSFGIGEMPDAADYGDAGSNTIKACSTSRKFYIPNMKKLGLLNIDGVDISPCKEYYGCLKNGNCVIKDDMDDIYPKLLNSDGVIIASPIFFYALSSQVKTLIDRSQALWARKYVLKQNPPNSSRKGVFMAVGATKGEKLFDGSILTVQYFFKCIGVEYSDELLIRGVDTRGEIKDYPDKLSEAFELGKRMAQK